MIDFQNSFNELARQWGWVSGREHQEVLDLCQDFEKQVQQQQITINELHALLLEKGLGYKELFRHLRSFMQEQSDQFHNLMESIRKAYDNKT